MNIFEAFKTDVKLRSWAYVELTDISNSQLMSRENKKYLSFLKRNDNSLWSYSNNAFSDSSESVGSYYTPKRIKHKKKIKGNISRRKGLRSELVFKNAKYLTRNRAKSLGIKQSILDEYFVKENGSVNDKYEEERGSFSSEVTTKTGGKKGRKKKCISNVENEFKKLEDIQLESLTKERIILKINKNRFIDLKKVKKKNYKGNDRWEKTRKSNSGSVEIGSEKLKNEIADLVNNVPKYNQPYPKPKLRFLTGNQATHLGIVDKNQTIVKIRQNPSYVPKSTESKRGRKKKVESKKGTVRKNGNPVGRPRKKVVALVNSIEKDTFIDYEDGRKLPSVPMIETSPGSPTSEAIDEFNKLIKDNRLEVSYKIPRITKLFDSSNVECEKILVNFDLSMAKKSPINQENFELSCSNVEKEKSQEQFDDRSRSPDFIDGLLDLNLSIDDNSKSMEAESRLKRHQVLFTADEARKRRRLHSSEFNSMHEDDDVNSFGIRSTVPSRQSLLPPKTWSIDENTEQRLLQAFRNWRKIPDLKEYLGSDNEEEEKELEETMNSALLDELTTSIIETPVIPRVHRIARKRPSDFDDLKEDLKRIRNDDSPCSDTPTELIAHTNSRSPFSTEFDDEANCSFPFSPNYRDNYSEAPIGVDDSTKNQNSDDNSSDNNSDSSDDSSSTSSSSSSCDSCCSNSTTKSANLSPSSAVFHEVPSIPSLDENFNLTKPKNINEDQIEINNKDQQEINNEDQLENKNEDQGIIDSEKQRGIELETHHKIEDKNQQNEEAADNDDAISLYAESIDNFMDTEYTDMPVTEFSSSSSLNRYKTMKSENIDKFAHQNAKEFDELMNNNENILSKNIEVTRQTELTRSTPSTLTTCTSPATSFNLNTEAPSTTRHEIVYNHNRTLHSEAVLLFRGFCYFTLKHNSCLRQSCPYNHKISDNLLFLHMGNNKEIKSALICAIEWKYIWYLKQVYKNSIKKLYAFEIIEVFIKVLESNSANMLRLFSDQTIEVFIERRGHLNFFINRLDQYITCSSTRDDDIVIIILINSLLRVLQVGQYWNNLRSLILKLAFPTKEIIEKLLFECINHPEAAHILDINLNVVKNSDDNTLMLVNSEMIANFFKLVDDLSNQNAPVQKEEYRNEVEIASIASPDSGENKQVNEQLTLNNNIVRPSTAEPFDLRQRIRMKTGVPTMEWKVHPIDYLKEPSSIYRQILQIAPGNSQNDENI